MTELGLHELERSAERGDGPALADLGWRRVTGNGVTRDLEQGVALISRAATYGNAEAITRLALFTAWGVTGQRDVSRAMDQLCLAAEYGSEHAQRELRFIAGSPGNDWRRLRDGVDIVGWESPRCMRAVSDDPFIAVVDRFLTPRECQWLIAHRGPMARARIYSEDSSRFEVSSERTNSQSSFTIDNISIVLSLVRERMSRTLREFAARFEVAKLLHYAPGEQFGLHADFLDDSNPDVAREVQCHGQRTATFLVYLNDDFTDGETDFPRLGFRFKGKAGDALFFRNVDAAGLPDFRMFHAGLPPSRGEKWLLSQWIRDRELNSERPSG